MDPTATLVKIRALIQSINRSSNSYDRAVWAEELAEAFEALDQWMAKGGFLPVQWRAMVRPPQ